VPEVKLTEVRAAATAVDGGSSGDGSVATAAAAGSSGAGSGSKDGGSGSGSQSAAAAAVAGSMKGGGGGGLCWWANRARNAGLVAGHTSHGKQTQHKTQTTTKKQDAGAIVVRRAVETKRASAMHGLSRTLTSNMVTGVATGFEKRMEMVGTGYRAAVSGKELTLSVGYSKPRVLAIPDGISVKVCCVCVRVCVCVLRRVFCFVGLCVSLLQLCVSCLTSGDKLNTHTHSHKTSHHHHPPPPHQPQKPKQVEKNTTLIISGADKVQLGAYCADIRRQRPPEPYKGKGIRFEGELIKLKEGKG
jgi:ribosomal protein L6P/L9E